MAVDPMRIADIVQRIERMGGEIELRFDDIGYLRIVATQDAREEIKELDGVDAIEIDGSWGKQCAPVYKSFETISDGRPLLHKDALTADNSFVPMQDMGIRAFQRKHPTFDGRGITIAVIEGCNNQVTDFLNPSLRHAMDLRGKVVYKIAGILDPTAAESIAATTAPAAHRIIPKGLTPTDSAGLLKIDDLQFHAPAQGQWFVGTYRSSWGRYYGVIWDQSYRDVWVDTDHDLDFRNEIPLTDINVRFSAGRLMAEGSAGEIPVQQSFAVSFDKDKQSALLYEGGNEHYTMTAGMAAGHNMVGGLASAAAPNAQIIIATPASWSTASLIETYIAAARDPRVNVISESWLTLPFKGVSGIILNRLVARFGVMIVHGAGNGGPMMNTLDAADDRGFNVLSVGAYFNADTERAFFGYRLGTYDNLWVGSSRGPTAGGRIKPDVVAPLYSISTGNCASKKQDGGATPILYRLPECYVLSGGTSAAAPAAAGAIAVLLSGVLQTHGKPMDTARVLWSVRNGARYLARYGAFEQGYGLIDIPATWKLLQESSAEIPKFKVEAPVVHRDKAYHYTSEATGSGLYEREGWTIGDRGQRLIRITRLTGKPGIVNYRLRWRGNDNRTFMSSKSMSFPLGETTILPVDIHLRKFGAHSAILEIIDSSRGQMVGALQATVVAARRFVPPSDLAIEFSTPVHWPDGNSHFFDVPEGTRSLSITLNATEGPVRAVLMPPSMRANIEVTTKLITEPVPLILPGHSQTMTIQQPGSGVWELRLVMCGTTNSRLGGCAIFEETPGYQHDGRVYVQIQRGVAGS